MRKKRRTFWITEVITPQCQERAQLLQQKGFEVHFFTSLDTIMVELAAKRAHILILSDEGDGNFTQRVLQTLMNLPEVQGARLVLMRGKPSQDLNKLAACAQFRDIIPTDIDDKQWLSRFVFATAGKPLKYVQPAGQIFLNNISAFCLPARIVWVSSRRMRIECRLRPPVGANLTLSGSLPKSLGVDTLSLKVVETQRSHLLYRFSDAVTAEWSLPKTPDQRIRDVLAEITKTSTGPRCRVFVAIQSNDLRNDILSRFEDPRFDVSSALQKQSIVDEPRFFSPDVVFIEDSLCQNEEAGRFQQMLSNLNGDTTVIILGHLDNIEELRKQHANRKILLLSQVPKELSQSILSRYLPSHEMRLNEADKDAAFIVSEHPYSQAEVTLPARLSRVHPEAAQISLSFPVSNFALGRLESPLLHRLLGRAPYIKLTEVYQDAHPDAAPFIYLAEGYLADIDKVERHKLATGLARLAADNFAHSGESDNLNGGKLAGTQRRTPELGSVKAQAPARVISLPLATGALQQPEVTRPQTVAQIPTSSGSTAALLIQDIGIGELIIEDAPIIIPEDEKKSASEPSLVLYPKRPEPKKAVIYTRRTPSLAPAFEPSTRSPTPPTKLDFKTISRFALLIGLVLLAFWAFVVLVTPGHEDTGRIFSDQFKSFGDRHR